MFSAARINLRRGLFFNLPKTLGAYGRCLNGSFVELKVIAEQETKFRQAVYINSSSDGCAIAKAICLRGIWRTALLFVLIPKLVSNERIFSCLGSWSSFSSHLAFSSARQFPICRLGSDPLLELWQPATWLMTDDFRLRPQASARWCVVFQDQDRNVPKISNIINNWIVLRMFFSSPRFSTLARIGFIRLVKVEFSIKKIIHRSLVSRVTQRPVIKEVSKWSGFSYNAHDHNSTFPTWSRRCKEKLVQARVKVRKFHSELICFSDFFINYCEAVAAPPCNSPYQISIWRSCCWGWREVTLKQRHSLSVELLGHR